MIQPLFEHRRTFAGFQTRVLELEGDGVPVALFHGYGDSADTWRQMLDQIAREGRRAIAVDLPGFGTADPLGPEAILPQLDEFALAAVRYVSGGGREPVVAAGQLARRLRRAADGAAPPGQARRRDADRARRALR